MKIGQHFVFDWAAARKNQYELCFASHQFSLAPNGDERSAYMGEGVDDADSGLRARAADRFSLSLVWLQLHVPTFWTKERAIGMHADRGDSGYRR